MDISLVENIEDEEIMIVKDLIKFREGFIQLPTLYLLKSCMIHMRDAFYISWAMIDNPLFIAIGFYFLNMVGDPVQQASLALVNSCYLVFFIALELAVMDKLGISLSVCYGDKDYEELKKVFMQGILSTMIIMGCTSFPLSYFSGAILRSIGIDEEILVICQTSLRLMILVMMVQISSDIVRTFCMAQGQEHYFSYPSAASLLFGFIMSYYLMVKLDMRIYGMMLSKLMVHLLNLMIGLWVYFNKTEEKTRGLVKVSLALDGLGSYLASNINIAFGNYSEFIGFEVATFFVAQTMDQNQIAALGSCSTVSGIFYCLGISFSIICRTRMNIMIGMKELEAAKNYFKFAYFASVLTGVLLSCILLPWVSLISDLYASSTQEMRYWFGNVLTIYFFFLISELSTYTSFVGMKTINRVNYLTILNLVVMIVLNIFFQMIVSHTIGTRVDVSWFSLMICLFTINFVSFVICWASDWNECLNSEEGKIYPQIEMVKV